ncbi:hypothetical protein SCLCIDRAFT_25489 [Scleroderma citrinum Foug A]|uniref:Uncharacterized protein n=1 Tax=Scleroderma citrinum Foug A TaxID=1036808 RepID=A0A0C3AA91_9AGAM|nr:hypothetical protein SCLCIDRAFT_25489 [Scleroderma citrinum Foug A]
MASPDLEQPPRRQYDCVCLKYGSGHLHKVSHTAWYQHLASACTEEEHQRIQTVRVLADRIASLPPLTRPSSTPDRNYSRARENRDPNEYVGRQKCACVRIQQPIEQAGPSNSGDQVANPSPTQAAHQDDREFLHFDDHEYDTPPPLPEEHDLPLPLLPEEHDAPPPPPPPEEHDAPPLPPPEEHDAPPPPPPPEEHDAPPPPPPEEHDAPPPPPNHLDQENRCITYQ